MTKRDPKNIAASVKTRLLNLARERGDDFNATLIRYGIERLLYRLSKSRHADAFVLKGAMLFHMFAEAPYRPTKDVDLLGFGSPEIERLATVVREFTAHEVDDDGLTFDLASVTAGRIKEGQAYEGIRVGLVAYLGTARIPLQIDIGFGDAITPAAVKRQLPCMLTFDAPSLRVYPWETVVAEKYQAIVQLGMTNSRMKDFFDLWYLAREMSFDGARLSEAIGATFKQRQTALPATMPIALTAEFIQDEIVNKRWLGFARRMRIEDVSLSRVIEQITAFVPPVTNSLIAAEPFSKTWKPGGPWS